MRKKSIIMLAIVLAASLLMSGCGTAMYELSEEEQEIIVNYAAYVVAKHNLDQKDGLRYVSPDAYLESDTEDGEEPDSEMQDETEAPEPDTDGGTGSVPTDKPQTEGTVTIAEAIGQADVLEAEYKGFYLTDNYKEGSYFSIDAKSGRKLVMVEVKLTNPTDGEVAVDVLSQGIRFQACFYGDTWIRQDSTLLLYDLSTYQGTLAAGESVDTVLMFEIPLEQENSVIGADLRVIMDGATYTIVL